MNKILVLIVAILMIQPLSAQVTLITDELASRGGLFIYEDFLYFGATSGIYRTDLVNGNGVVEEFLLDGTPQSCGDMEIVGNEVYVANGSPEVIFKFDITDTNPQAETVVGGTQFARGLDVYGNFVYIAERDGGIISRIDITQSNPVKETVINVVAAIDIEVIDNFLYISQISQNKISKFDLTSPTPSLIDVVDNLVGPVDIDSFGNDLYIAESQSNKISKIDVTQSNPVLIDVLTNLEEPRALLIEEDILYFSEEGGDSRISKVSIPLLNTDNFTLKEFDIYPNPSDGKIQIQNGDELENYSIFHLTGKVVSKGKKETNTLDLSFLESGIYFLKFEGFKIKKLIIE